MKNEKYLQCSAGMIVVFQQEFRNHFRWGIAEFWSSPQQITPRLLFNTLGHLIDSEIDSQR